jgi:glucose dehydrogenase
MEGERMSRLAAFTTCGAMLLLANCAHRGPDYPVTQQQVAFSDMDATQLKTAPAVTDGVTGERIADARSEPHNWLTYYGAYDGPRFSSLDQINAANVNNLKPAWVFQAGVIGLIANPATYSLEAAPIVVDGVMFLSGWDGYVWALKADTGELIWRYRHAIPLDVALCCGNVNRGVALKDFALGLLLGTARLQVQIAPRPARERSVIAREPRGTCSLRVKGRSSQGLETTRRCCLRPRSFSRSSNRSSSCISNIAAT